MTNFTQIENYAKTQIRKWKFGWKFRWTQHKTIAGQCDYDRKEIQLSKPFCEVLPKEEIKDTILHEIAHALTSPEAPSHGTAWKLNAIKVGAKPQACLPESLPRPKGPLSLHCAGCNQIIEDGRWRRTNMANRFHKGCSGKGGPLTWRKN